MSSYFFGSIVVMCMRAGLYQQKKGLFVFLGSFRPSQSMTWLEISSSTPRERSSVSGPSSLPVWFLAVPSEDFIQRIGRGGVRHGPVFGSIAPGTGGIPGVGNLIHSGAMGCSVGLFFISFEPTPCIASRR